MRKLDMADRYWHLEARRLSENQQSFTLVARGNRAARIRSYLFVFSQRHKRGGVLRYTIAVFRALRFHYLYMNAIGHGAAIGVENPDADTVAVTFYGKRTYSDELP
jgi:hypothetical protein